ncbi:hypothetical protein KJ673_04275 [Patescibacteria group bacterium]|nr:hypothetical protein [Patescibacteria group bacterium]MBU4453228.1 hypothetical protein [Patescibacteria group bacterium]MCG2687974.1 hypothetical protein [Candidatus Parcubacteria bacterium]
MLVKDEPAERFLSEGAEEFTRRNFIRNDTRITYSWIVPDSLENESIGDACDLSHALEVLLCLDSLTISPNTHIVSDLLATIFEAGFQAGLKASSAGE